MALVQFIGPGIHERVITKKDFDSIGAEGVEGIHVIVAEDPVVELPDNVVEWLVKNEKGDWKAVTEEQAAKARKKVAPFTKIGEPSEEDAQDAATKEEEDKKKEATPPPLTSPTTGGTTPPPPAPPT